MNSEVHSEAVWDRVRQKITNSQKWSPQNENCWRIVKSFGSPKATKKRFKTDTRNQSNLRGSKFIAEISRFLISYFPTSGFAVPDGPFLDFDCSI